MNIQRYPYLLLTCFPLLSCHDAPSKNERSQSTSNYLVIPNQERSPNSQTAQLAKRSNPLATRAFQLLTNAKNLGSITDRDIMITARSVKNTKRFEREGHTNLDWTRLTLE